MAGSGAELELLFGADEASKGSASADVSLAASMLDPPAEGVVETLASGAPTDGAASSGMSGGFAVLAAASRASVDVLPGALGVDASYWESAASSSTTRSASEFAPSEPAGCPRWAGSAEQPPNRMLNTALQANE
jgi:hypothetical protein